GAKNKLWLKRKADILGKTLTVPKVPESVCFGAALQAGIGAGIIKNPVKYVNNNKKEYVENEKKLKTFYNNEYRSHYMKIYRQNLPYWEK
ncbi:MAG: FGGY-family carbohydrate kinase, partial [Candidatus Firestonebacteria bacterium]